MGSSNIDWQCVVCGLSVIDLIPGFNERHCDVNYMTHPHWDDTDLRSVAYYVGLEHGRGKLIQPAPYISGLVEYTLGLIDGQGEIILNAKESD